MMGKTVKKQKLNALIAFMIVGSLLWPDLGHAFFTIDAASINNEFSAGTLEIGLSDNDLATTLYSNATSSLNITISDDGSMTAQYELSQQKGSCADGFYAGLDVVLSASGTELYSGGFSGLAATSTGGVLSFDIIANDSMTMSIGETCLIYFTVAGWQTQFATSTDGGFSDIANFTLTVTAGDNIGVVAATSTVVLNEIYPATLSTSTEPLDREWVELYNGTSFAVDVAGWVISELSGGSATEHKYEIATSCPSTTPSKYVHPWNGTDTLIPAGGLLVIEFCGGANYLNDGGDTVSLYTGTSTASAVDSHTYPNTANGKSHARIPDGGTWVDPIPTPGQPNVATKEDLFGFASDTLASSTVKTVMVQEVVVASSTATSTLVFDNSTSTQNTVSTSTDPDIVVDEGVAVTTNTDTVEVGTSTDQIDTEIDSGPEEPIIETDTELIEEDPGVTPEVIEDDEEAIIKDPEEDESEEPTVGEASEPNEATESETPMTTTEPDETNL